MKKLTIILLTIAFALSLFVSCNADVAETVFAPETIVDNVPEYAKLLGTELAKEVEADYQFGKVIKEAVIDSMPKKASNKFTISFWAEQTSEPTQFIISTEEDSPAKAWVEVEVEETKTTALPTIHIYIKTNAKKFLANKCCFGLFAEGFDFKKVKELNFNDVFDTSETTDMAAMFTETKIDELDLSCFNTEKVTDMTSMFEEASINKLKLGEKFIVGADTNIGSFAEDFQGSKITGPEAALRTLNTSGSNSGLINHWTFKADGNNSTLIYQKPE